MIDMASVYAERYKKQPQMLQAAVMGQSPDPKLDPYTALNALRLVKESQRMAMAGQAQMPTSSPSIVAENIAPIVPRGLGAMVPGAMGQVPQSQVPVSQAAPMQAASGGLAGLPTPEEDYAAGGIVAFQDRGYVNPNLTEGMATPAVSASPEYSEGEGEQDDYLAMLDELEGGAGNAAGLAAANRLALATARRIASRNVRDLTPEEAKALYSTELEKITKAAGPSPYAALRADLAEQGKERASNLEFAKGEALLQAAAAVLEGNNAIRGLAKGGAQFAKSYGEAQRADKAAKRSMAQMEFSIADAERKERMGNSRAATAAVENARKARADYNKAELERDKALGTLATNLGRVNKASARGAGEPKPPKLPERLYDDNLAYLMETETPKEGESTKAFQARMRAQAGKLTAREVKDFGPEKAASEEAKATTKTDTELDKQVAKDKFFDPDWVNARTTAEQDAAETALRNRIIARRPSAQGKPAGGGVNKNSTTAPNISTIKGAPEGAKIGSKTAKGWEVLDSSGNLIGYAK